MVADFVSLHSSYSSPPSSIVLSVIVCTRARSDQLERCMASLETSGRRCVVPWELIVVDNDAAGGVTSDRLEGWNRDSRLPLRIVREPRVGLSIARNAGVRAAAGELLAFTDDDCLVAADWHSSLLAAYSVQPNVDAIGGWVGLHDGQDAAVGIRTFAEAADVTGFARALELLIGCNFSVRRRALAAVGEFDERLGAGSAAQSAEDLDVFVRLIRAGARVRYEPSVRVHHAHGRRSADRTRRGYLVGRGACYAKHALSADRDLLRHAAREIWQLARSGDFGAIAALTHGAWTRASVWR